MSGYNGHASYEHWNVALWLFNDEGLYELVKDAVACTASKEEATNQILNTLYEVLPETPDGVEFTYGTILAAIEGAGV